MRLLLAVVAALLADTSSFVINAPAPALFKQRSRSSHATMVESWFDQQQAATSGATDGDPLNDIQVAALDAAMRSLDQCGELTEINRPTMPRTLFTVLRTPGKTPSPEEWDAVRATVLDVAGCSDEALLAALMPLKEVAVDRRSLATGKKFSGGRYWAGDNKGNAGSQPSSSSPAAAAPAATAAAAPPPPPPPPLVADPLTADQVAALNAASMTQDICGNVKSAFGKPQGLFSVLRRPSTDPTAEEWDQVRLAVLDVATCSDDALNAAMRPLKEKFVDIRSLDRGRGFEGRYYGGVADNEAKKKVEVEQSSSSGDAGGGGGGFDLGSFFSSFGQK